MLLDYLVKSETRKQLLSLFLEGLEASVHELSQILNISYGNVHGEVSAMIEEGLVLEKKQGRSRVLRLNLKYSEVEVLRKLFNIPKPSRGFRYGDTPPSIGEVKANLASLGAPIMMNRKPRIRLSLEEALAAGVFHSKGDAGLLRVLPILFFEKSKELDYSRLKYYAERYKVKSEVGFVLDLTAELSADRSISRQSQEFWDARRTKVESYFAKKNLSSVQVELEKMNTPEVSQKWCFSMNVGLDSFQSFFDKHRAA